MMNEHGKSGRPIVPAKSPNKAGQQAAEGMEGRGLTKGNLPQQNASRTPSRRARPVRWSGYVKQQKNAVHGASPPHLQPGNAAQAYFSLKREAAPGVDGETWRHYGETLEDNLQDLPHRLKRGGYRAKPVRRV